MIRALLTPANTPASLIVESHRAIISQARKEAAALLARAKKRARSLARKAEERGFNEGLQKGEALTVARFKEIFEHLCQTYATAADLARQDVARVACHIVERTISSHLESDPSHIQRWINEAIESLKTTRSLTLRYHPRYETTVASLLSSLTPRITPLIDPTLGDTDFILEGPSGGVSFAWRELLQPLHTIARGSHD